MQRPRTRTALIVATLLVGALAIRVAEVQDAPYRPVNDAGIYLRLAGEIAHLGGYSTHDRGAGGSKGPSAYFPPGYPYFLATVEEIDGHTTPLGRTIRPARLSQAVLGTVTVALVGLLGYEAFGETVALIALALAAGYPVLIELSGTIVAENLATPLILAAVWAAMRSHSARRRYRWVGAAGVLTGLSALTHENALLLVIPLVFAVWPAKARWSRRSLAAPALLIAAAALTISPWTIRNAIVLHRFIPVSDETGITLVGTYNPASAANRVVPYKWRLYYGIPQDSALRQASSHLTEPQLGDRLQSQALLYIEQHPGAPFVVAFHNALRLLELEGSFAWHASAKAMGLEGDTAQTGVVSFWIVGVLALAGLPTRAARRAPRWLWAMPILLALSVVLVNVETPRFREPVDPFLILLAACAVASAAARVGVRLRRSPVGRDARSMVPARDAQLVEVVQRTA